MKTHFDIEDLIENRVISNELDLERAMIADRKLRLLSKENSYFKNLRKQLRNLIEAYEARAWRDVNSISDHQLAESDKAEAIAEQERIFIDNRKQKIRKKLKTMDLTQENLGQILGHQSKTHMSELMNGIRPFTLRDLVFIHQLLDIDLKDLVPSFLSKEDLVKVQIALAGLNKSRVRLKPRP